VFVLVVSPVLHYHHIEEILVRILQWLVTVAIINPRLHTCDISISVTVTSIYHFCKCLPVFALHHIQLNKNLQYYEYYKYYHTMYNVQCIDCP